MRGYLLAYIIAVAFIIIGKSLLGCGPGVSKASSFFFPPSDLKSCTNQAQGIILRGGVTPPRTPKALPPAMAPTVLQAPVF